MSEGAKVTAKTPEPKRENSSSRTKNTNLSQSINSPIDQILFLQRTVGNQAVQGLLKLGFIQAKLTIGQPGDIYEQEADRVAEQVMRMPDAEGETPVSMQTHISYIQRMCKECEEELQGETKGVGIQRMCSECEEELHRQPMEEEEEILQAKEVSSSTPEATPSIESQINGVRNGGQPLPESVRAFFEPRFGYDFSQVRIHTDSGAGKSAKAVNALAYTVGRDIVFGAGQYAPGTESGKKLIAHELTHVVQQGGLGSAVQQASSIKRADDTSKIKDDGSATFVSSTRGTDRLGLLSVPTVQRMPDMSREEEKRLSLTSPGEIAVSMKPPMISLYNFAIERATLKGEHLNALRMIGVIIRHTGFTLYIAANGHADSSGDELKVNVPLSRNRAMEVRKVLQMVSGVDVDPSWFGESKPVATNDTVEGRSRNRRVDILFVLPGGKRDDKKNGKKDGKKDGNGGGGGGGDGNGGDGDGWTWPSLPSPCDGLLGALFCGVIACALAPEICLFCLENPEICLGRFWRRPPKKPTKPSQPKKRIACIVPGSVDLPKGKYTPSTGFINVSQYFEMKMVFKQEPPDKSPYCDCNCGEYRQYVSGFFERNYGKGSLKRLKHKVAYGLDLDPNIMREDGDPEPYGHRYTSVLARFMPKDAARSMLAPNRDKSTDPKGIHDKFVPDRENGCAYEGADQPGMNGITHDESFSFHLKFEGGPVDACNGNTKLPGWSKWEIKAERIFQIA